VIELMSPTDSLEELQSKMEEYISCGVKLGWLIDPDAKEVAIYRFGQDKQVISNPSSLSGEELLSGLIVDLTGIF
jgi:Uma2 family endonuclease